jgi:hypothetical protein
MNIFIFKIQIRILKNQIQSNKSKLLMFHKNKLINLNNIKKKLISLLIIVLRSYLFIQVYLHYLEGFCLEQYVYFHVIVIKRLEICKVRKKSLKVTKLAYHLLSLITNKFLKKKTLKLIMLQLI